MNISKQPSSALEPITLVTPRARGVDVQPPPRGPGGRGGGGGGLASAGVSSRPARGGGARGGGSARGARDALRRDPSPGGRARASRGRGRGRARRAQARGGVRRGRARGAASFASGRDPDPPAPTRQGHVGVPRPRDDARGEKIARARVPRGRRRKTRVARCLPPRDAPAPAEPAAGAWVEVRTGHGRAAHGLWRVYDRADVGRALPGRKPSVVKAMATRLLVLNGAAEAEERPARSPRFIVAEPATGRTHQIRLHCAHVGLSLEGDVKYGGRGRGGSGDEDEDEDEDEDDPGGSAARGRIELPTPSGGTAVVVAPPPAWWPDRLAAAYPWEERKSGGGGGARGGRIGQVEEAPPRRR